MNATSVLAVAATIGGLVMAFGPLLQIARILKRRHSGDVSVVYLSVICIGAGIWAAYGVALGDAPLIIANTVGVVTNLATIIIVWRYRHGPGPQHSSKH